MDMERHVDACTNAVLPGNRRRLLVAGVPAGWADIPGNGDVAVPDAGALATLERQLAADGRFAPRGERFDVHRDGVTDPGATPPLATADRGVLPLLGIGAYGVHLNGLVRHPSGAISVWIARRAMTKKLDPGKLDHMVGGGVAAGMGFADTLIKEAQEEAGLDPALTRNAERVGTIRYACLRAEGLRRDVLACYDLWLTPSFRPRAMDGEVADFELWPVADVVDRVRRTDDFKFNDNLVLMHLFLRLGILPGAEATRVAAAMERVRA